MSRLLRPLRLDYTQRLMAAYTSGLLSSGEVAVANVEHDPGCPTLRGRDCRCVPNITITTNSGLIHVEPDGTTRREAKQ